MRIILPLALVVIALLPAISTSANEMQVTSRCANMPAFGPRAVYILPYPTPAAHPQCVPATPYAYGWFGVPRRRHMSVHHGHYSNYTQHTYQ